MWLRLTEYTFTNILCPVHSLYCTEEPESPSDTSSSVLVLVAGVAASGVVLGMAAVCIVILVIWWR